MSVLQPRSKEAMLRHPIDYHALPFGIGSASVHLRLRGIYQMLFEGEEAVLVSPSALRQAGGPLTTIESGISAIRRSDELPAGTEYLSVSAVGPGELEWLVDRAFTQDHEPFASLIWWRCIEDQPDFQKARLNALRERLECDLGYPDQVATRLVGLCKWLHRYLPNRANRVEQVADLYARGLVAATLASALYEAQHPHEGVNPVEEILGMYKYCCPLTRVQESNSFTYYVLVG